MCARRPRQATEHLIDHPLRLIEEKTMTRPR
jgi:glycerol dehydrogenase-like iron-containing ADH family enzyme